MNDRNETLNKTFIKDALKKYLRTEDPEDFLRILINISLRIKDEGTVPALMKSETRIALGFDPDLETEDVFPPEDEPAVTNRLIVDEEGNRWLPLFTGYDELGDPGKTDIIEDRPVKDIIEEAFNDGSISGLVIDPYSDALSMKKELLYVILNLLDVEDQ